MYVSYLSSKCVYIVLFLGGVVPLVVLICCMFEYNWMCRFVSCEEALQLTCGRVVVLPGCPFVSAIPLDSNSKLCLPGHIT